MISVVVPVFNGAETLAAALESIVQQEMTEFEMIIIDDCSTDSSADVMRDFEKRDSRIRGIYHPQNIGLAASLNEGLETATFDLVARMDQDDEALPQRLLVQWSFMNRHPEVVASGSWVYHMGIVRGRDRLVRLPSSPAEIRKELPRSNCIYHPSVIVRRAQILKVGGYRERFKNAEDYDLWLRLVDRHSLANIPEPLLRYRFSIDGMTLARKWEQLYYVYLAQVANQPTTESLEEAEETTSLIMSLVDKNAFLSHVRRETAEQLRSLGWVEEARDVAANLGRSRSSRERRKDNDQSHESQPEELSSALARMRRGRTTRL